MGYYSVFDFLIPSTHGQMKKDVKDEPRVPAASNRQQQNCSRTWHQVNCRFDPSSTSHNLLMINSVF